MKRLQSVCIFVLLVISFLGIGYHRTEAQSGDCYVYAISLSGQVIDGFGSYPFNNFTEYAVIRVPGWNTNPLDFAILSGQNINATASIGLVEYMTNSSWAANQGVKWSNFDLSRVVVGNGIAAFSYLMESFPPANTFVVTGVTPDRLGGLGFLRGMSHHIAGVLDSLPPILSTGFLYPINVGGWFSLQNNGQIISGQIQVNGQQIDNASNQGIYSASFVGSFLGNISC